MTINDYLDLITSEYRDKPDFVNVVTINVSVSQRVQDLMTSMIPKFDVDIAVGDQLDIVGQWVGITRNVRVPITGVFFSWDDPNLLLGWDSGIWEGGTQIVLLDDAAYRTLIKAKIAANHWNGTTDGAYEVLAIAFPNNVVYIQDYQDMSYSLLITGPVDALTRSLILGGYLPLKPEGVRVYSYMFPFDTGPIFGWDLETATFQGWNEGSWVEEILA